MRGDPNHGGRKRDAEWLSTGEAARLCSVTSDAIQKWIRQGRLTAQRTAGGHYRIALRDIAPFVTAPAQARWFRPPPETCTPQPLRCWEYLSVNGEVRADCLKCVVYRVRASWCFAVLGRAEGAGHSRLFCRGQSSCKDCAYYQQVCSFPPRVLVVGPKAKLQVMLHGYESAPMQMEFASGAYETSRLIGEFRPFFVVVDDETLLEEKPDWIEALAQETRIPGMKVILAASSNDFVGARNSALVFDGFIRKPFNSADLSSFLAGIQIERSAAGGI